MLTAPYTSEYDPAEEGEGSIDPLGLAATYERLADRMLPGVTVRMGRPRFLTAIAVGARVCEGWDADELAKDGVTPAWLVFEWFVAEALGRAREESDDFRGFPGVQKVERAIRNHRPVSASTYLKTPTVFGFTGIFRRLARHVQLITDEGRMDDAGFDLIRAWETDQGLYGFLDGREGEGAAFRERLKRAVAQGMEQGATTRQSRDFWLDVARRLNPTTPGRREREVLCRLIETRSGPQAMVMHLSAKLRRHGSLISREEEPAFMRSLARGAPAEMPELISAIDAYESFCGVIVDGFTTLQYVASKGEHGRVTADQFAASASINELVQLLPTSIERVRAHPHLLRWERELESVLGTFDHVGKPRDFFDALLGHHQRTQNEKPPNGKRMWVEGVGRGRATLRARYFVDEPVPESPAGFVHEYRIPTFARFLDDLGAFR